MQLIRGDWDEKLHWPVRYKQKFSILYEGEERHTHESEFTFDEINNDPACFSNPTLTHCEAIGIENFATHSTIRTLSCDNSISFQFVIEILSENSHGLSHVVQ